MRTTLQLDIWLQRYEEFVNAKNSKKTKELEHCFCHYISKLISPTSDSFLLIMSHNVSGIIVVDRDFSLFCYFFFFPNALFVCMLFFLLSFEYF